MMFLVGVEQFEAKDHDDWDRVPNDEDCVQGISAICVAVHLIHDGLLNSFGIQSLVLAYTFVNETLHFSNFFDYCPDITSN